MLSPDDGAIVAREPDLTGLRTLMDPDAFLGWVRARCTGETLLGATAVYARYKARTSCMVLFDVQTTTGTVPVTAVCYHSQSRDKLAKARAFDASVAAIAPGVLIDDDFMIVALVHPIDRALPVIARLHDPSSRDRTLRKPLAGRADGAEPDCVLRYKPERRMVARWRTDAGPMLLKAYVDGDYELPKANADAVAASGIAAPPLASSERHRLLMWEWIEGDGLDAAPQVHGVRGTGRDVTEIRDRYGAAAAAIARLHRSNAPFREVLDQAWVRCAADAAVRAISDLVPQLAQRALSLSSRILDATSRDGTRAPIHGDCSADQCLVTRDAVALIDFDSAGLGHPAIDIGNFAAKVWLDHQRLRINADTTRALLRGFQDAYRSASMVDIRGALPAFTALGLLRAATSGFRTRDPGWHASTEATLTRAEEVLSDR